MALDVTLDEQQLALRAGARQFADSVLSGDARDGPPPGNSRWRGRTRSGDEGVAKPALFSLSQAVGE
jgi:hypothetical protein